MKKNYFTLLFLFAIFFSFTASSQTYKLDDGMVGRTRVVFKEGSYIKIQDTILVLQVNPGSFVPSLTKYTIVQDETEVYEDREIRTLRLLSPSDSNLRIHGTIVTGESVRNTLSANLYDMSTQTTTPYVIFIEN